MTVISDFEVMALLAFGNDELSVCKVHWWGVAESGEWESVQLRDGGFWDSQFLDSLLRLVVKS